MFRKSISTFAILLFFVSFAVTADQNKSRTRLSGAITDADRDVIRKEVVDKTLQNELQGSRYRVFGIQSTTVKTPEGVRRYVYTLLYDYTHNKTYNVVYDATNRVPGKFVETLTPSVQPPPNREEYEEAKAVVSRLERVQNLLKQPNVILQESFPTDTPAPCDISRCVEIQVNEVIPKKKQNFLLLVTVDLSTQKVVDVRQPKTPTTIH
jgi:hypothetical protein